jgi:hypothetical protein
MTLTTLTTSIGLAAAVALAAWLGGAPGSGVLAGFCVGAAVTGWGVLRQRRVLRSYPQHAMRTMVEGFLAKLALVAVAAVLFVLVPALRQAADWRSFLLAFAAAVLLVLLPGTFDNARILKERRAQ